MGQLGHELKFQDTGFVGAIVSSATATGGQCTPSATVMLCCPLIGSSPSQRDGHKIMAKEITIRGQIFSAGYTKAGATPGKSCSVVGYLIKDTQCNGVLANSSLIFDNTSGSADMTTLAFRDMSTTKRFKILKKQLFEFPPTPALNNGTNPPTILYVEGFHQEFEWRITLNDIIEFDVQNAGASNDVAALTSTNYIPVFFTNNSDYAPSVQYASRVRFIG